MPNVNDFGNSAAIFQWGAVICASLVAALWDIKSRRIPNVLTLPLLAAGLVQAAIFGGWAGLTSSLGGMAVLAVPYVLLYVFAGGGAGDAKLMGAIGAWLGLGSGLIALFAISICAIVMALLKALFAKQFWVVLGNIKDIIISFMLLVTLQGAGKAATTALAMEPEQERLTMPYGPAIFAGVVIAAVYQGMR